MIVADFRQGGMMMDLDMGCVEDLWTEKITLKLFYLKLTMMLKQSGVYSKYVCIVTLQREKKPLV